MKFLEQPVGLLPEARLRPAPAFHHVMLDLFGPYTVRGEVQKYTSAKAYGVMFTNLAMRAVYIEVVFGYDTSNFLMALSRFASLPGWPEMIYSNPGSQLVGAERELEEAWQRIDRVVTKRFCSEWFHLGIWICRQSLASRSSGVSDKGHQVCYSFLSE